MIEKFVYALEDNEDQSMPLMFSSITKAVKALREIDTTEGVVHHLPSIKDACIKMNFHTTKCGRWSIQRHDLY